jgi:hypothetical protein
LRAVRRVGFVVGLMGLALLASGAAAAPLVSDRCRTLSVLRFKGDLYFHHELELRRPRLGRRQGVGLERAACDEVPGEEPPPWVGVPVFALEGIRTAVAVAPARRRVVFYDPYVCSPRLGETRFLRCLRRR